MPSSIRSKTSTLGNGNSPDHAPGKSLFPVTDLDRGIVGWEGQDDPHNSQNFASAKKWTLLALMSSITFISPLASSMFSPAVGYMAAEFGCKNETLLSFTVSVYILGYVFGPLFLAPLSEIYGRRVVLSASNWFFVVWQIGCALSPNIAALIVFRFFAGVGGVGCLTLGAGVIADIFPIELRGVATSLWAMGPLVGPVAGPIAGGFIGETIGWRWIFWILLIAGGVLSFCIECLNQETYPQVLIRWKTKRVAKELCRSDLRSAYEVDKVAPGPLEVFIIGVSRPMILLVKSPIVLLLSLYMALVYGLLYLFFTTITSVFEDQYGFSTGLAGLASLGIGVGFFVGLLVNALTSDRLARKLTARNNGNFFWYGWTADKHVHWIVPIIGCVPFGFGMMASNPIICDRCYNEYAASANAA